MRNFGWALVLVAGCWRSEQGDPSGTTPRSVPGVFTITTTGVGPIDATTPATLAALRAQFAGYEVRPVNDESLEYDVLDRGERLMAVVPNDDASVFVVRATSSRIGVVDHPWRVGADFHGGALLTDCECWHAMPTCYKKGEHVAVGFNHTCDGLIGARRNVLPHLNGTPIAQVVWSPNAFGDGAYGGVMYGGDGYGGGDPCAGN